MHIKTLKMDTFLNYMCLAWSEGSLKDKAPKVELGRYSDNWGELEAKNYEQVLEIETEKNPISFVEPPE